MPETSRGFHNWQPAPRWKPFPWLANPVNPATRKGKRAGTRHTDKTVEEGGQGGKGEAAYVRSPNAPEEKLTLVKTHTNEPNATTYLGPGARGIRNAADHRGMISAPGCQLR